MDVPSTPKCSRASARASSSSKRGECSSCPAKLALTGVTVPPQMQLTPPEQQLVDAIAARRDALVALTSELVSFDTVTHTAGAPPRQERALQDHVAAVLRAHGAEVELHEPDAAALRPHPMVPEGLTFDGRPQLVGPLPAAAAGGARCC